MAGSREADMDQYDNGGLLDKIKKAFLRGLESLQYELKKFFCLMCVAVHDFKITYIKTLRLLRPL